MRAVCVPDRVYCPSCNEIMYWWVNPDRGSIAARALQCDNSECQFHGHRFWVELPTIELTDLGKLK